MTKDVQTLLKSQRAEIDNLDAQIINLLAQRYQVVAQIAKIKHVHNIDAVLPERIQEVIEHRACLANQQGVDENMVRSIWTQIIDTAIAQENAYFSSK